MNASTRAGLAVGALVFLLLATANAGGYRYGVSDQAFYIPAIAQADDPALFPADAPLLAPQRRWWVGDELLAAAIEVSGLELPALFLGLYVLGLALLFGGVASLARAIGSSWWAVAGAATLITLRHRIARTGANSLEGYMHPRMIAFALGVWALACLVRRRPVAAAALVAAAGVAHPTTALWFAGVLFVGALVRLGISWQWRLTWMSLPALMAALWAIAAAPRMDAEWLAVLGEKDYLFPHAWPLYAWTANLAYPVVLWLIHRRRQSCGAATPGERAVVAGCLGLVAAFLVSVPLAAAHIAPVVQLQVNRVFWVLDAVTVVFLAWWLIDDRAARHGVSWRVAVVTTLVLLATVRGAAVLTATGRPLVEVDLPDSEWTDVMAWLDDQPKDWAVLVDPGHAWKYGTSVRAAALRDTVLELGKDSAMAMYDRSIAVRVAERARALSDFSALTTAQAVALARRFGSKVLIAERGSPLGLPVLYETPRFVVYDVR